MINVAIIGVGGIAGGHIAAYHELENANLLALCDVIPERAQGKGRTITTNLGTGEQQPLQVKKAYTDYRECLADAEIDMVDICLPSDLHAPVAIAALEAGKHVLCEKPMALTVEDCDRMIAAAEANHRLLMVAQVIRFWPEYLVLKDLVDSGTYGKLRTATFRRISSVPRWTSDGWMTDPERGGGCTLDLHVHDADFINYLLGLPREVYARGVEEDYGMSSIMVEYRYDDEKVVFAESAWLPAPEVPFRMPFIAYLECAVVDFESSPLKVYPLEGEPYTPELSPIGAMTAEINYFLECVEKGVPPVESSPQSTRDTIRMVLAEVESVHSGRPVGLKPVVAS
ncbi:MAG: Gfo/Idh/MocA family protein [Armatimonadota bacterium]